MVGKPWLKSLLTIMALSSSISSFGVSICEYKLTERREGLIKFIEQGDKHAAADRYADATYSYLRVFNSFMYQGENYTYHRCAERTIYQEAAVKLRAVVKPHSAQLMEKGRYLWDEHPREHKRLISGALYLLLVSNSYDAFIEHSFAYAKQQLRERDIDQKLHNMVINRLKKLENTRNTRVLDWDDDTNPLFDEELVAFEKLANFRERLQAYLKPLYPKITDYWLAEETKRHKELVAFDNEIRQSMLVTHATGAIEGGQARLIKRPGEVQRLVDRANQRGEGFMSKKKYRLARAYFKVAGNDEMWAQADTLTRRGEKNRLSELKAGIEEDIKKMQKTDEEKANFEDSADSMAEEFGFDLED